MIQVPVAFCSTYREGGIWKIIVEHCPYCGQSHEHGGGAAARDVPLLGRRVAHCQTTGVTGEYELEEA